MMLFMESTCQGTWENENLAQRFEPLNRARSALDSRACLESMNQAVHPRVRGDNDNQRAMRRIIRRFTPACAGTTPRLTDALRLRAVHPRVRGDNSRGRRGAAPGYGSPPRARGQRVREYGELRHRRFTPACAGTTCFQAPEAFRQPVHPRVRGDNQAARCNGRVERGSPPRARGQLELYRTLFLDTRFTPACAGTTAPSSFLLSSFSVHPRVRGDNTKITLDFPRCPPAKALRSLRSALTSHPNT